MSGPVGASPEVIEEHLRQHPCDDEAGFRQATCPCGSCAVLVCEACNEPVFLVLLGEVCEHAEELHSFGSGG